jgi:hypothetical protein
MENISRGPTYGDFYHYPHIGSMQDNTVAILQSTRVSPLLPLLNVMYCVRVSLMKIKIFNAQQASTGT